MTTPLLPHPDLTTEIEWAEIVDALTRREFIAGGAALGAAGLGLAALGTTAPAVAATKGWRFTDSLGRTVHLAEPPKRVAALDDGLAATLWSAGLHVVAAPLQDGNWPFLTGAGMPRHGVVSIQPSGGAVNIEALAKTKPDLIVDATNDGKLQLASQNPQIAKVAPVIGINESGPTVDAIINRAQQLVTTVGIPLADKNAHTRYLAAEARLRKALATKPGLRAVFCFADGTNGLDVMVPDKWPFMQTLADLGVHFIVEGKAATGAAAGYFQEVSWELVPQLPVDLFLYTGTPSSFTALAGNAAWKATPAVKAGQYAQTGVGWYAYYYKNYTTLFDNITNLVDKARTGVGPK